MQRQVRICEILDMECLLSFIPEKTRGLGYSLLLKSNKLRVVFYYTMYDFF